MRGKIAASSIITLLLLLVAGTPALSGPPDGLETYDAGADSVAFDLNVGLIDFQLAAGLTFSGVTSEGPEALGDGTAVLIAGTESGEAQSTAPGGPESADECAVDEALPPPINALSLAIACVSSTATLVDGAPAATANSDSITIPVTGSELTEQLLGALVPVTDEVLGAVDGLLEEVTGAICEGAALPIICELDTATDVVNSLLEQLGTSAAGVLTITVAPNSSAASADDVDGVIASAVAEGAVIELLPGVGPGGSAFLEIVVGSSEASVVRDATTAEATPVANPAVAQVNVNGVDLGGAAADLGLSAVVDPLIGAVNDLVNQLAAASPLSCGEPGPLAEIVCLDAGAGFILDAEEAAAEGYDFGEGTVGARTSALRLELLSVLNDGEPAVSLSLAEAVAAANATPVQPTTPTTAAPPTTERPPLPRTGSSNTPLLAIGAALAGATMVVRLRRRALKR